MKPMNNSRILVIDDELEMLNSTSKVLKGFGFDVFPLHDSNGVQSLILREKFDLIICDLLMPKLDGLEILEIVKVQCPEIPVIIFSAYGTIDRAVSCMRAGALDFIEKPFDADHLKVVVEKAVKYSKLYQERNNLIEQLEHKYKSENIIGSSRAMLKIFEIIESVAKSEANIFISGESGTGKELIARSIHAASNRKTNPFVPVNCGAFPENLFEAEMFGYEKGSFTGASEKKIGLLEYANTGTFFLDEVSELPLNLQIKLLRVLQDRQLRRIGGNDLNKIDVRIISATNQNPKDLLAKSILREDFYFRLNVINIHIPPLRERIEDVRLLSENFLRKTVSKANKNITGFKNEVLETFENYNWPGNVRELENIIERAVALSKDEYISISDLPSELITSGKRNYQFSDSTLKQAKNRAIEEVEKQYLHYLLDKHNGNVTKASEEAGMTRRNTYRLVQRYNIDLNNWRE
ncbi:MAG: sigma-54 dependent transcriptional regulator [Bacteroidetes bacterium]|nr:sigma-54 dependent transcriptional regulator [Bacteroidota bacterium]